VTSEQPEPPSFALLRKIAEAALDDAAFRQRLLDNPKAGLKEMGLKIPANVEVIIHRNTKRVVHLVLPSEPRYLDLDDDDDDFDALHLIRTTPF
jgi:hypothetical protein